MVSDLETKKPNNFKHLLSAYRTSRHWAGKERARTAEWTTYDSPVESYEYYFRDVFSQKYATFLESRTKAGKDANVLDLMSTGAGLRQLPIQAGLALTLGDGRTDQQKAKDKARSIDVIEGNILFNSTWRNLKGKMEARGVSSFGLELCRPDGGTWPEFVPYIRGLYYKILDHAWDVLSPDGGTLLVELPANLHWGGIYDSDITLWIEFLKENNIDARHEQEVAICLVRNDNLHPHLPIIS